MFVLGCGVTVLATLQLSDLWTPLVAFSLLQIPTYFGISSSYLADKFCCLMFCRIGLLLKCGLRMENLISSVGGLPRKSSSLGIVLWIQGSCSDGCQASASQISCRTLAGLSKEDCCSIWCWTSPFHCRRFQFFTGRYCEHSWDPFQIKSSSASFTS